MYSPFVIVQQVASRHLVNFVCCAQALEKKFPEKKIRAIDTQRGARHDARQPSFLGSRPRVRPKSMLSNSIGPSIT